MGITVGMVSLGCSKNLVDGETMLGEIAKRGYKIVADPQRASIIIVNTCTFIESAQQESVETILEMAGFKDSGVCKGLIVTGCMAQMFKEQMMEQMPEIDAVLGTGSYDKICEAIESVVAKHPYMSFESMELGVMHGDSRIISTPKYSAYIKIAEGCDNRCAYCAIPSVRGNFRSREISDVVAEAKDLAERGVKELIVIAQDITRFGEDLYKEYKLDTLLEELVKIEKIGWIRLHYCYPDKMTDSLIDVIAREDKIVKYLDIPVQHGSDKILKAMNRRGDRAYLNGLFKKIREKIPQIVLRTSFIVGFPGETEDDFLELCDFLREVRFERVGAFTYSAIENTPAYYMENQIDDDVKRERQEILMNIAADISLARNEGLVGKTLTVLCEGMEGDSYIGRSYGDSVDIDPKVIFESKTPVSEGDFVEVLVERADVYDLYGGKI